VLTRSQIRFGNRKARFGPPLASVYEDPNGSNYQTNYAYDVLDDLTQVSQGSETRTFVYDSLKRLTSAANPESGTVSYQYDNNGNLTQKTDARPVVMTFGTYDAINRPTTKSYTHAFRHARPYHLKTENGFWLRR
jgi:YD repeat-containing protein